MKTVAIGASGHVGVNLVRALISKGREVRALSHSSNLGLEDLPVEFFKGDVCDIDSLAAGFRGADVVLIINPTGIIGPYDYRPSHQGQALLLMASGRLPVLLEGGFDWVDARDVSEYAIRVQETAPAGSSYLFSGHWLSVRELVQMATAVTGKRSPSLMCPMTVARDCVPIVTTVSNMLGKRPIFTQASLNALVSNKNISHTRASRDLGYEPRPVLQTIDDTIKWFTDNGYFKGQ
jgi:dihydroflavonol-4-reductase